MSDHEQLQLQLYLGVASAQDWQSEHSTATTVAEMLRVWCQLQRMRCIATHHAHARAANRAWPPWRPHLCARGCAR